MKAIILAAGMGRRLGLGLPKCLTPIVEGYTILDLQLAHLARFVEQVTVVVGYQAELIMRRYPECAFVRNLDFETTNTAASLALGLEHVADEDTIWVNGDVACASEVFDRVLACGRSALGTKRCSTGDEEVKYKTDAHGRLTAVSKTLTDGQGEAVGVNIVRTSELETLRTSLAECRPQDYFERGVERAIAMGAGFHAADVTGLKCIEIDFPADLATARELFESSAMPAFRRAEVAPATLAVGSEGEV